MLQYFLYCGVFCFFISQSETKFYNIILDYAEKICKDEDQIGFFSIIMNQIMTTATQQLLDLLSLTPVKAQRFMGQSVRLFGKRVFGGQILAQAIMAAAQSCDRPVNSLHAYFIRPGDSDFPIEYEVTCLRDGQKFSLRQIHAYQHGQLIFTALISMSIEYAEFDYQATVPPYPAQPPQLRHQYATAFHLHIEPQAAQQTTDDVKDEYVEYAKTCQPLALEYDHQIYHQAILAYYSDYSLLNIALRQLDLDESDSNLMSASLDHSLYFHRDFRVDQWLRYQLHCPSAQHGRGLNQGTIWQNNQLVCSAIQESLIRLHK